MTNNNLLSNIKDTKFKPGWKGGPGRPRKLKTQVKDFIKEHPYAVETLMHTLYEQGVKGDREAAMYIIDRVKGKPKQTTDITSGDEPLGAGMMVKIFELMAAHQKEIDEARLLK